MEFIEHATAWCKGEIFESRLILVSGIVILILAFLFYKVGTTPNAKAMFYPLLVIAIIFVVISVTMNYSNANRIAEFQKAYTENPDTFVQAEKDRVENFMTWYPMTLARRYRTT